MTLTNAQTGDVLSLQGQAGTSGTLAGGIGFSISGSTVTCQQRVVAGELPGGTQLLQFNNTRRDPDHDGRGFAFQINYRGVQDFNGSDGDADG